MGSFELGFEAAAAVAAAAVDVLLDLVLLGAERVDGVPGLGDLSAQSIPLTCESDQFGFEESTATFGEEEAQRVVLAVEVGDRCGELVVLVEVLDERVEHV